MRLVINHQLITCPDVVIWDSHPLSLGSTPQQVFIDGVLQLTSPHVSAKPPTFQFPPNTPNFNKEATDAFTYEGLPPLKPRPVQRAIFTNVSSLHTRSEGGLAVQEYPEVVVVYDGNIICSSPATCPGYLTDDEHAETIDLKGGSIVPGLTIYGTPLGLVEIRLEPSTNDGRVFNPLSGDPPAILGDGLIRAIDGLQFEGRNAL